MHCLVIIYMLYERIEGKHMVNIFQINVNEMCWIKQDENTKYEG